MVPITHDIDAWMAAGGAREALDVLASLGTVRTFTDGTHRCLAGVHPARPTVGTVADWSGAPEVLSAAESWLREQGCTEVLGPQHLVRWFPYRANQGPHAVGPMLFEATTPAAPWEAAGYEPRERYVSIVCRHREQIDAGTGAAARLALRGWTMRPLGDGSETLTRAAFDEALGTICEVVGVSFTALEGFVPVPKEAVADWYRPYRHLIDPRLVLFVFDPQGRPAGFVLGLPDQLAPERRWFQIVTLAVVPAHQGAGVGAWMVAAAHQAAQRAGFDAGVHGPVKVAGDRLEDTTWFHGELVRRYALYRKAL